MLHEAIFSASHAALFILAFFQTKAPVNNFISLSQSSHCSFQRCGSIFFLQVQHSGFNVDYYILTSPLNVWNFVTSSSLVCLLCYIRMGTSGTLVMRAEKQH